MFRQFVCLCLALLCSPALGDLSDRPVRDWSVILEQLRAEVGLSDIGDNTVKPKATWRFTYMRSLALDSPNVITVEELNDGSARVLVTKENVEHQRYRVALYNQMWICNSTSSDEVTISCLPVPPQPTGPKYETVQLTASKDDVARLRTLFAAVPVCEQPESPPAAGPGLDGSDWLFEMADGGRYCLAHRWSPSAGDGDPNSEAFRQLGLYMALLARGRIYPM
jgi:hypothetical protein